MPDTKITALTALTAADPANDVLPIVDVSDTTMAASGTTKKISINNVLGCSGTATLASATISGNLTVDTNTFFVDSANNRVIVGHTSGSSAFQVTNAGAAGLEIQPTGFSSAPLILSYNRSAPAYTQLTLDGSTIVHALSGTTAMTLNSTGLGVGVSPDFKFAVNGTQAVPDTTGSSTTNGSLRIGAPGTGLVIDTGVTAAAAVYGWIQARARTDYSSNFNLVLQPNGGNVGIGVTPANWSTIKALQVGAGASLFGYTATEATLSGNTYYNAGFKYVANGQATQYQQQIGEHRWFNAPSGTAGNAISFTQAMTLDASGNLLVGKSVSLFSTVGVEASGTGFISATNSASTNATTNLSVYSTGAAAFRFYVGLGGTVFATNTTISAISDARLKENVQDIDVGLGAILALKPRKFDWKAGKGKDIKGDRGFIAQEFEQVFPNLIDEWKDEAPEGEAPYKSVRQDLIPVLVKAIQELAAEVNALKNT